MTYLRYLRYILRHRWYVMVECFKFGLIKRGLLHDLSKFLPSEFLPYAKFFYGKKGSGIKKGRNETGYYKPTDTGDSAFDFAWLLHQKRNRHHWQWWVLPEDGGGLKILSMPRLDILEMICDWKGAGKAQGHFEPDECQKWYQKNKDKLQLHPRTRNLIEFFLGLSNEKI